MKVKVSIITKLWAIKVNFIFYVVVSGLVPSVISVEVVWQGLLPPLMGGVGSEGRGLALPLPKQPQLGSKVTSLGL